MYRLLYKYGKGILPMALFVASGYGNLGVPNCRDIGGQTLGSKMLKRYIAGADAILFTYDITNYQSFQNLEDWVRVVTHTNTDDAEPEEGGDSKADPDEDDLPYFALLGNKSDLSHVRTVRMQKHAAFAEENGMSSFLLSAKTGDQVPTTFFKIAADLAGIPLSKPDTQVRTKVVKAELVDHDKDDPDVKEPDMSRGRRCTIQ
eukprot:gb/GECG01000510.1/.p1 GENE.gb/GECG01000510.1/~~gb/GECG01000510.1/.p1  ORF type:complete len:203 (+),score=25.14 gb/GECG01000510.1/:1-609(+)